VCDRYEVHLICDEIAVGCGRTGTFFAHEQAGIRPDFLCLSKGISGGYLPLSIVLTTDRSTPRSTTTGRRGFLHSHSYTGNALACRAALATLDIFAEDQVIEANRILAAHLGNCLGLWPTHPQVRHLRQRGMIAAFDVLSDDPQFSQRFYRQALAHEILLRPIGNTDLFHAAVRDQPRGVRVSRRSAPSPHWTPRCTHDLGRTAKRTRRPAAAGLKRKRRTLDLPLRTASAGRWPDADQLLQQRLPWLANDPALIEAPAPAPGPGASAAAPRIWSAAT
jgi:hypothetical protein